MVGGSDGQMTLNSVEIYDFSLGHWTFASNLYVARANMGAVVMGDKFFLIGGFGGKSFLKSLEVLHAGTEEWSPCLETEHPALEDLQHSVKDSHEDSHKNHTSPVLSCHNTTSENTSIPAEGTSEDVFEKDLKAGEEVLSHAHATPFKISVTQGDVIV